MKVHRFYIEQELVAGVLNTSAPGLHNQVRNVLKLRAGEAVTLFNGRGTEAVAVIAEVGKEQVSFAISEIRKSASEPKRHARLYLAILKNEHFELAAQKAVECGVAEIIPVVTARTVKLALKLERVRKIMLEAAEQSGRGSVPVLAEAVPFAKALTGAKDKAQNILCDGTGDTEMKISHERVGIWIGPEGGFSPEEVGAARAAGFTIATLGSLTLRAETAAIIATYLATK